MVEIFENSPKPKGICTKFSWSTGLNPGEVSSNGFHPDSRKIGDNAQDKWGGGIYIVTP